jgi:hypothetical protein
MKLLIAVAGMLALVGCEGARQPAEGPAAASTSAASPPSAAPVASASAPPPMASASASATAAMTMPDKGVAKTVDMKWEIVSDSYCKPNEKHVRFRYVAAPTRMEDRCSNRLAEELQKKKLSPVHVTFLVYDGKSYDLCDVEGVYTGVRLAKRGCRLPDGWDSGIGGTGIEGKDVPHPLFP